MAATITDTLSAHLEQVAPRVAVYYNYDTDLAGKLAPSTRAKASRYLYRQPIGLWIGGRFQKYIADRGDMGSGSGMKLSHLTAGFFDSTFNFELTKEQIDLSESSEQSRINVMSETMAKAMVALQRYDNIFLFGDGTGKLTNSSDTSPTTSQLTFNSASDTLNCNQIFEGMEVDIWDTTGATKRANGPYKIIAIDWNLNLVTFHTAPTAMASTDLLAVIGADSYGPSSLTSFSSTWPGEALTSAPGLTGDSWRHGLRYVNDATPARYYLGRLKSTITQLMPTAVDASNDLLTYAHGELGKNLTIQRRGNEVLNGCQGVMHMAQQHRLKDLGIAITRQMVSGNAVKLTDLQPQAKYNDTFYFADIPCSLSRVQDKARVDFFNPALWGRVEGHPAQFYKVGNTMLFPLRSSSTANLLAGLEFKIVQKMDWVCEDPGAGFYIHSAKVESGYAGTG